MISNKFLKTIFFSPIIFLSLFVFAFNAQAHTGTIDTINYTSYLCSDNGCTTGSRIVWRTSNGTAVSITDSTLTGNLWGENVGWIKLNPSGNTGVVNDGNGNLSGYAWGQNTGWINFDTTNSGVSISTSSGEFSGYAWSQNYGWIKFDCTTPGSNYCVKTDWRPDSGGGSGSNPITPPVIPPIVPPVVPPIIPPVEPSFIPPELPPIISPIEPPIVPPVEPPVIPPTEPPITPIENVLDSVNDFINSTREGINIIFNNIINGTITSPVKTYLEKIFTPKQIEQTNTGLKVAAVASVAVGSVVSLATMLFLNPLATPELILIPFRLWALLLTALGLKKRIKPWGTVYDSVTKQPLDPVYVSLFDLQGREIGSSITDIDGRYGFYVEPGVYKVVPKKTNYLFPSSALAKQFSDELYRDLYFGDYLNINEGEMIIKNIPMDPVNFDWNEFAKNKKQLFKFYTKKELILFRISNWLFGFGFTVATTALIISPEKYNIIIFSLYIVMFILRRTSFKLRAKGRVVDSDGVSLAFALVRIFSIQTNVEITHKVTDKMGRYHILIPNGSYYVKIEKKNDDGTYSLVHTSNSIQIIHGTLNKVFNI